MSVVSFQQAQSLVLSQLRQRMQATPVSKRNVPQYIISDPVTGKWQNLSINDLIVQVERDTALGHQYVEESVQKLTDPVTGFPYVIQ